LNPGINSFEGGGKTKVDTKEYVEYLFSNYNEILKDIKQLKFELEAYEDLVPEEIIEAMNFSSANGRRASVFDTSEKTCKIALIYNEVSKRMNNEAKEEIRKMIVASEYEIRKLNYCIDRLEPKIRDVIKSVYIDKMAWLVISKNLYISENTISKYKRKGIEEITEMYRMGRVAM
jgi:DNA-directed RNA polymerase specialized sigma subunit